MERTHLCGSHLQKKTQEITNMLQRLVKTDYYNCAPHGQASTRKDPIVLATLPKAGHSQTKGEDVLKLQGRDSNEAHVRVALE